MHIFANGWFFLQKKVLFLTKKVKKDALLGIFSINRTT